MNSSLSTTWALEKVERLISIAIAEQDADKGFEVCEQLADVQKKSGLALAKALWMMKNSWSSFEIDDDFFDNAALRLSLHRQTIVTYTRVIDMLQSAPENIKEALESKNIKDLVPIANAIEQGYDIEDEQWEKLTEADSFNNVSKVIREDVKGVESKSNSIVIKIDRDGTIWAWNKENRYFIGSLEVNDTDEIIKKAVERIICNTGMIKV